MTPLEHDPVPCETCGQHGGRARVNDERLAGTPPVKYTRYCLNPECERNNDGHPHPLP